MDKSIAQTDSLDCGQAMYQLATTLFPICRSITGEGVRETLAIIQQYVPVQVHEVPTGTRVFDWLVPNEWNVRDAYVLDERGYKVIDFHENNLHVLGYSIPVDMTVSLSELQKHLYSLEDMPDAIPYVTSYYEEQWGFCVSHAARQRLVEGQYRVVVDSELTEGSLTYGELIIPGMTTREVLLSTYVCHPSMANNETSGPAVTTFLAKWIASAPRRHTYRIVFVPETIGSLAYLSRNLAEMKRNIVAGFNVTCVGDDRAFSFLPSRKGSTLADRAALCILRDAHPDYVHYSFLDRGSDERQYCSPGVELPVVSIMRSKYGEYPEYHTSLDNLDFITPKGLQGGFSVLRDCLELLEANLVYQATCLGEPQLSRRGLYPKDGGPGQRPEVRDLLNVLAYADGTNDLIDISTAAKVPAKRLYPVIETLLTNRLLVRVGGE